MRRLIVCAAMLTAGCGAFHGATPPPIPPVHAQTYNVACVVTSPTGTPVVGARCFSEGVQGTTNQDGYVLLLNIPAGSRELVVDKDGWQPIGVPYTNDHDQNVPVTLTPKLPALPTHDEIVNVRMTFQGLMVNLPDHGTIPWFEAALPWLSASDRQIVYAAKHASTAWPGGDTHALIGLPSGGALYDEPNQPYAAVNGFGPLDWTTGNTKIVPQLADLVVELLQAGFKSVLLFEGGDGRDGYPIADKQLDLLADALGHSVYGDLRPYVVVLPGWDGVFYGWEPSNTLIPAWLAHCKATFPYCGLEHGTGHFPIGNGAADFHGGGLTNLDLLLHEFDDDRYDGSIWQIAARALGPAYVWPPDEPSDADSKNPPWYLGQGTVPCAFEFHEYTAVHSNGDPAVLANTVKQRNYLRALGYACGG